MLTLSIDDTDKLNAEVVEKIVKKYWPEVVYFQKCFYKSPELSWEFYRVSIVLKVVNFIIFSMKSSKEIEKWD